MEFFAAHSEGDITAAEWIRNVAFKRMSETDWLADYNARRGLFQGYDREYEFPVITRPDALELPADVKAQVERERADVVTKYNSTSQWLKAPNGEPSNLSEDLWIAVRTPAFIRWFGDWQNSGGTSRGRQINEYGTSGFASLPTSTPTALHATGTQYSTSSRKSQGGVWDKNGGGKFSRLRRVLVML